MMTINTMARTDTGVMIDADSELQRSLGTGSGHNSSRPLISPAFSSSHEEENNNVDTEDDDIEFEDLGDIDDNRPCCQLNVHRCRQIGAALSEICQFVRKNARKADIKQCMRKRCSLDYLKRRLPIINWLPKYRLGLLLCICSLLSSSVSVVKCMEIALFMKTAI